MTLNLLGVAGSMRIASYSTRGVRLGLQLAEAHGARTQLLDLRQIDLPMFRPDDEVGGAFIGEVAAAVRWADAFLLGSPDYHGSMSGALKNFLDYHWQEFTGKLFGYVCSSHEKGLTAMDQMRTAVRQCYGWSLPYGIALHGEHDFDAAGELSSPRVRQRLAMLARDLVVYGALVRRQFLQDVAGTEADTFAARLRSR